MKKEARAEILKKLQADRQELCNRAATNRTIMRSLVQEQTKLKRKIAEYQPLIRSLLP